MPDLAVLSVKWCSNLSASVLPAIGAACPALENVELAAALDTNSFAGYDARAPAMPSLERLRVQKPESLGDDHLYV